MAKKHYLALDIGTTNWKAAVFDQDGKLEGIERCPTKTHSDESGHGFYMPDEIWESYRELIRKVVAKTDSRIDALSVASVGEAVVPVDVNGNPLDNIVTWYDSSAGAEADELKNRLGPQKIYSITGLDPNPIFSLPKIMHVTRRNPVVKDKVFKWLQVADYMLYRLSGEMATDYTLASRTLAFDVVENSWSPEMIRAAGFDAGLFPNVVQAGTVIGLVPENLCRDLGFSGRPKVVMGGHDHPCGTVVTGAVKGGRIHDSSGTAEAYIRISEKNRVPEMAFRGQRTCRWLEKDRYITIGGIVSSGVAFDWAYSLFADPGKRSDYTAALADAEKARGIQSGLIFYPNLRGAGAPWWDPSQAGSFIGLRDSMKAPSLLRAAIEGLCMQTRVLLDMHESISGTRINSICVVGGSSRNRLWQQLKADITGRNVELCFESEATALGAAMLAAIGDGEYRSVEEAGDRLGTSDEVLTPREGSAGIYDRWYEIYRKGYEALEQVNSDIYRLTGGN